MKRESRYLLNKACDSLQLGIELLNRPHDRGRKSAVLILLDHSLEMLLKAVIVQRGGSIWSRGDAGTIGLRKCVNRGLTDAGTRFLTHGQAVAIRIVHNLRGAAQHHVLEISEPQLYLNSQSAVTVFREILNREFDRELVDELPNRVLPVSTTPPQDLVTLFDSEVEKIIELLKPGRRRHVDAIARIKALAAIELGAAEDEEATFDYRDLQRTAKALKISPWEQVFPNAALVNVDSYSVGTSISIRLSKREGPSVRLVSGENIDSTEVAVKRVNELDFYNLGAKQLAEKLSISVPKLLAAVEYLGLQDASDCFKEIQVGKSKHKRYSSIALAKLGDAIELENIDEMWRKTAHIRAKKRAEQKLART